MNGEVFYPDLVNALIKSGFKFSTLGTSEEELTADRDKLSKTLRFVLKLAPSVIKAVSSLDIADEVFELDPIFSKEGVQKILDNVGQYTALTCFKYMLAQPIILAVVEADPLTADDLIKISNKFDEAVVEMLEFTGKMGGKKLFGMRVGGTRLSVTGIILFVFFDHASALRFVNTTQKQCKIQHFWKKTWVLPWVIDVAEKDIKRHTGLPIIVPQILNSHELIKTVFQS